MFPLNFIGVFISFFVRRYSSLIFFCNCQDPIDAHYEMLKTEISVLEETSEDYKVNYLRSLQCCFTNV
jgi:hypothetical protein